MVSDLKGVHHGVHHFSGTACNIRHTHKQRLSQVAMPWISQGDEARKELQIIWGLLVWTVRCHPWWDDVSAKQGRYKLACIDYLPDHRIIGKYNHLSSVSEVWVSNPCLFSTFGRSKSKFCWRKLIRREPLYSSIATDVLRYGEGLTRRGSGNRFASGRRTVTKNGNKLARMTQTELLFGTIAVLAAFKRLVLLFLSSSDCTVLSHFWVCNLILKGNIRTIDREQNSRWFKSTTLYLEASQKPYCARQWICKSSWWILRSLSLLALDCLASLNFGTHEYRLCTQDDTQQSMDMRWIKKIVHKSMYVSAIKVVTKLWLLLFPQKLFKI